MSPRYGRHKMELAIAFLVGVLMTILTIIGDYFIKKATLQTGIEGWKFLTIAAIVWASSVIGWFFVFKKMKVTSIAILYNVSGILLLTLVGIFIFKEKVSSIEIVGLLMAIGSLIILARFG